MEAAANKGHVDAMIRSGDCYYEGIGTEQDYGKALEWYQKVEEHGAEVDMDKLENARKMSRKGVFQKLKGLFKG